MSTEEEYKLAGPPPEPRQPPHWHPPASAAAPAESSSSDFQIIAPPTLDDRIAASRARRGLPPLAPSRPRGERGGLGGGAGAAAAGLGLAVVGGAVAWNLVPAAQEAGGKRQEVIDTHVRRTIEHHEVNQNPAANSVKRLEAEREAEAKKKIYEADGRPAPDTSPGR